MRFIEEQTVPAFYTIQMPATYDYFPNFNFYSFPLVCEGDDETEFYPLIDTTAQQHNSISLESTSQGYVWKPQINGTDFPGTPTAQLRFQTKPRIQISKIKIQQHSM